MVIQTFKPGQRVNHADFGEGVVVAPAADGYLQVFFPSGERRVYQDALHTVLSRTEQIIANVEGTPERLRQAWLHYETFSLPLIENAAALTAARIDLLPHQVVLTHRITTAFPRRFLVADEVGLGLPFTHKLVIRNLAAPEQRKRLTHQL